MIYKVLEAVVTVVIVVVLAIINGVIYIATGGDTFIEDSGDKCIELLTETYLATELPDGSIYEISCDIKDAFPTFLSSIEFQYSAEQDYFDYMQDNFQLIEKIDESGDSTYTFSANSLNHFLNVESGTMKVVHEITY